MDMSQIILGRPCLFDKDVTIYDRFNICQFEHKGKKIKLFLLRHDIRQLAQRLTAPKKTKEINIISERSLIKKWKKRAQPFPLLALLSIPPFLLPTTIALSFSPTSFACSNRQSLPHMSTNYKKDQ